MSLTLQRIADWVEGAVSGDPSVVVHNFRTLHEAGEGDLTFVDSEKFFPQWKKSKASAAIVSKNFPEDTRPLIRVDDPIWSFLIAMERMRGDRPDAVGIDPTALIHPTAVIGPGAAIGPFTVIGEGTTIGAKCQIAAKVSIGRFCKLGDNVTLDPNVVIYDDSILGNRVIIHANSVIGADGFGYRLRKGKHVKIPHHGSVDIGDDVEIGACSTVDRGMVGPTRVGTGSKIDNHVMISHNCQIGEHNIIVGQVGIAGSCSTGKYVVMAGQVGIADHIHIGDHATLGAQCGIITDVPPNSRMLGTPAMPGSEFLRSVASWARLPQLRKEVARLSKLLESKKESS